MYLLDEEVYLLEGRGVVGAEMSAHRPTVPAMTAVLRRIAPPRAVAVQFDDGRWVDGLQTAWVGSRTGRGGPRSITCCGHSAAERYGRLVVIPSSGQRVAQLWSQPWRY